MKLSPRELVMFVDLWSTLKIRPKYAKLLLQREVNRRNRKPRRGKHSAR